MSLGSTLRFRSNIYFEKTSYKKLLPSYKDVFIEWKTHVSSNPKTAACFLSQFLPFKNYIQRQPCVLLFAAKIFIYVNFFKKVI